MLPVRLGPGARKRLEILCIGAHSDDIEIGCGATVLGMLAEHPRAVFHWVVLSSEGQRGAEARRSAARFLGRGSGANVIVKAFRSGYFPFVGDEIKDFFESLKRAVTPDVIFTHHRDDRHQDHGLVSDLTWSTFRDDLILEYEVAKYDGDLGRPNLFVPATGRMARRKSRLILSTFASQRDKHWFTEDAFLGLMRLRGVECASPTGYAEAFYARKTVLGLV
jgi:LmbE family N-acetylglucosaminyl deacetylase